MLERIKKLRRKLVKEGVKGEVLQKKNRRRNISTNKKKSRKNKGKKLVIYRGGGMKGREIKKIKKNGKYMLGGSFFCFRCFRCFRYSINLVLI